MVKLNIPVEFVASLEDGIQLGTPGHRRHENADHLPPCYSQKTIEVSCAKNWRLGESFQLHHLYLLALQHQTVSNSDKYYTL